MQIRHMGLPLPDASFGHSALYKTIYLQYIEDFVFFWNIIKNISVE